jgi:serine/threonine protein kinase/tetratricopeptide (TPR) repeat protein
VAALRELGQYSITRALGEGGMGQVWHGVSPQHLEVAIKLLHNPLPKLEARFRREFRLLQKLSHPNVVSVLEFGEYLGRSYLVMEYVNGQTLDDWTQQPPQDSKAIARLSDWGRQIAGALDHIHHQGVVHRDLKPENVLLTKDGIPKITDFGLAHYDAAGDGTTQLHGFMGTLNYASPEQLAGRALDHRADLYAFGAMLYHLFTGHTVFSGETTDIIFGHLQQLPRPPRDLNPKLPREIEQLILALLQKNPANRPDSAQAVLEALGGEASARLGNDSGQLLQPPFLGRQEELARLQANTSPGVLLEGEAGVGKSRLLEEWLNNEGGNPALSGPGQPNQGRPVLWANAGLDNSALAPLATWLNGLLERVEAGFNHQQRAIHPVNRSFATLSDTRISFETLGDTLRSFEAMNGTLKPLEIIGNTLFDGNVTLAAGLDDVLNGGFSDGLSLNEEDDGLILARAVDDGLGDDLDNGLDDGLGVLLDDGLINGLDDGLDDGFIRVSTADFLDESDDGDALIAISDTGHNTGEGVIVNAGSAGGNVSFDGLAVFKNDDDAIIEIAQRQPHKRQRDPRLGQLLADEGAILANILPQLGEALPLSGDQGQYTLFASALRMLEGFGPQVLVLEQAERADAATLNFVAFVLRSQSKLRLVLASRPDELESNSQRLLAALLREGSLVRHSLAPLPRPQTTRLVQAMLGGGLGNGLGDEALLNHVLAQARGNPWMAGEVLRSLLAAGQVYRQGRGWVWNRQHADLSENLRETLALRFAKLERGVQDVAALLAVIGEPIGFEALLALVGGGDNALFDALEALLRSKIIEEELSGQGGNKTERYRFSHPLLQETALARLPENERCGWHQRYALILEATHQAGHQPLNAATLCKHWVAANQVERAVPYALEAARQAEALLALPSIEAELRAVLAQLPTEHPKRPALELASAKIDLLVGRSTEAEARLAQVLPRAEQPLLGQVKLVLAELYQKQSRWAEAVALLEGLLAPTVADGLADGLTPEPGQTLGQTLGHLPPKGWQLLVSCLRSGGKLAEALVRLDEVEAQLDDDKGWRAYFAQQRAAIFWAQRDLAAARPLAELAVRLADEAANPAIQARAYVMMGHLHFSDSHESEALAAYQQAKRFSMAIGDWRGYCATELNAATMLVRSKVEEALERLNALLPIAEKSGYKDIETRIYNNLAYAELMVGDFYAAKNFMEASAALSTSFDLNYFYKESFPLLIRIKFLLEEALEPLQDYPGFAERPVAVVQWKLGLAWQMMLGNHFASASAHLATMLEGEHCNSEVRLLYSEALRRGGSLQASKDQLAGLDDHEWQNISDWLETRLAGDTSQDHLVLQEAKQRMQWEWYYYIRQLTAQIEEPQALP